MSTTAMAKIDTHEIEEALVVLRQTSETIVVNDAPTCLIAKTAQRDVRNYMKDVHLKLDPFVESAKRNLQDAKDELNKWLNPAQAIDEALAHKVKDFERREREAAEAEQRRINEENSIKAAQQAEADRKERERAAAEERKRREAEIEAQRKAGEINKRESERLAKEARAAQEREKVRAAEDAVIAAANVPQVEVKPNIPTVAGVPSRRPWKFRIIDANKIPRVYMMPNEVSIGYFVRENKKAGEVIPGVEAYQE
jgi:hypothetical protein